MSNSLISQVRRSLEEATGKRVVVIRAYLGEEVEGVYGGKAVYLAVVEPDYVLEQLRDGSGVFIIERARPGEEFFVYIVKPPKLFLSGREELLLDYSRRLVADGWSVAINGDRLTVSMDEVEVDDYWEAKKKYGDILLALSRVAEEASTLGLRVEGSLSGEIEVKKVVE